ncbi:MAG: hypothetical protein GY796_15960 [Chloroflexi bacterium]|nr:hypothetical protein [Chloroflexota bacterium]
MKVTYALLGSLCLLMGLLMVLVTAAPDAQAEVGTADSSLNTVTPAPEITTTQSITLYIPIVMEPPSPYPLPPPIPMTGTPPIDFTAVQQNLHQQGLDLSFNKIGFHTGVGGNITGLDDWMNTLDAAGVPIFLKSADNAEPLFDAQQLRAQSGVPHTLIFRRTGAQYDVPNYNLPPKTAAQQHWALHKAAWPPELNPSVVWIETINEVDKNRSEWLGQFALETAQLALADGYRWAGFGWSSGEPEPEHWEFPAMLDYLRLASRHPDRLAVTLHEYSFDENDIGRWYPYLVGRFQLLFEVCDAYNILRPTVFITEWGWQADTVPAPSPALSDIAWAAELYAAYPQVKGAAIWYLGGEFGGIADKAQLLIQPARDYSLSHYFAYTPGQGRIDPSLFAPAGSQAAPAYMIR